MTATDHTATTAPVDPPTITPTQVEAALQGLGIDLGDVRDVELSYTPRSGSLAVTRLRRGPDGKVIKGRHGQAVVTTVIPVERPLPPVEVA